MNVFEIPEVPGYVVEGLIGGGAAGQVYAARELAPPQREVALKLLQPGDDRFAREVALMERLEHPGIVRLYLSGEVAGRPFLALERVEGDSLEGLLPTGALGPSALAVLLADVAEALAACHAAGIVHRDLKPANVILTADLTPKLIDFGLGAFLSGEMQLTASGVALGTPLFVAPEVYAGGAAAAEPAADVFALGVMLHLGFTGAHPFGNDLNAVDRLAAGDDPDPLPDSVPPRLATLCRACLSADPARRPAAAELARGLREPATPTKASAKIGVGSQVGPYRLVSSLGSGGMGQVFLGEHRESSLRHAVKVVQGGKEGTQRLVREATVLARLSPHPGVVKVHTFDLLPGQGAYFACEWVEGQDLQGICDRGPLSLEEVVRWGSQVAAALGHLHGEGVVHRDIKPANVVVRREDGQALLVDFGLSLDAEAERLTRTDELIGTPQALTPEQVCGTERRLGPAGDVYALGVLLYELAAGHPPYQAPVISALILKIVEGGAPPPSSSRPGLPPAFDALVLETLALDPAERPSAQDVAQRLLTCSDPVAAAERGSPLPLAVGIAVFLVAGALGWAGLSAREPEVPLPSAPSPRKAGLPDSEQREARRALREALESGEGRALARLLDRVRARDAEFARDLRRESARALLERAETEDPRQLLLLAQGLRSPELQSPELARLYVMAAEREGIGPSAAPRVVAHLQAARSLDPSVEVPRAVANSLAMDAYQLVAVEGRFEEGADWLSAALWGGAIMGGVLPEQQRRRLEGVFAQRARRTPQDWVVRYWHAHTILERAREGNDVALAREARESLELALAAARLTPEQRREFEYQRLQALKSEAPQRVPVEAEALLPAADPAQASRLLEVALRALIRLDDYDPALTWSRRHVTHVEAQLARADADLDPSEERRVRAQLATAYDLHVRVLLKREDFDAAEAFVARAGVRPLLDKRTLRAVEERSRSR